MFLVIVSVKTETGALVEMWSVVSKIEYQELIVLVEQGKLESVIRMGD